MNLESEFKRYGVILEGHFKLTSGRHSNLYINKDKAFTHNILYREIVDQMVQILFKKYKPNDYDIITGPAVAGLSLASPIALFTRKDYVYPEKSNTIITGRKEMIFRRGYDKVLKNKRVIITEDIITTGSSVQQTIDAVNKCDGRVICVLSIWNRSNWGPSICPLYSLIESEVQSWDPEDCPMCKEGIELQDPKSL